MRTKIVSFLIAVAFLSGCSAEEPKAEKENQEQAKKEDAYQQEIRELKLANAKLEGEIWAMKVNSSLEEELYKKIKQIHEKYPWLAVHENQIQLTKLVIERYADDPEAVTVTDPRILKLVPSLLTVKQPYLWGFPNGYKSEVGEYIYTLHTKDQSYQVHVVGRGIIAINEDYLEVSDEVHQLGAAFVSKEKDYGAHIFTKIQESGVMIGSEEHEYALSNPYWIKNFASLLISQGDFIQQKPGKLGEEQVMLTFYYQSEQIRIQVYPHHIKLTSGDEVYWLELMDAGQQILGSFSAG